MNDMPKMNPGVKKKWVAALRSGKYKQTIGNLKTSEGYCCLGVLCDLHRKRFKKITKKWRRKGKSDVGVYMTKDICLPTSVVRWAKLSTFRGAHVRIGSDSKYLDSHNDTGATFEQIAQAIEDQL